MMGTSEYPQTVGGRTWVNPNAFIVEKVGPCFWCGQDTYIIDVCYDGYYCQEDDAAIERDLRKYGEV